MTPREPDAHGRPPGDPISAKQFHDAPGTEGWHVLYEGAQALFPTRSHAEASEFVVRVVAAATELGSEPDIDLRPESVTVRTASGPGRRLCAVDIEVARQVSAIARHMDLSPDPSALRPIQIAVAEGPGVETAPFWLAVLGYERRGGLVVDPLRRSPRLWFDEIATAGRGRTHVDVAVPNHQAGATVAAMLAAGGRLADDSHAPDWWTLASPDNHGIDIAAWGDVNEEA
jgi:4a-hydroxytetrahydrobiopterin dehydratase